MAAILTCGYLMVTLPMAAWVRFVVWLVIGLVIYFLYGFRRSRPNQSNSDNSAQSANQ
jgi:APA family basic amino acid/polyamine antiporter